MNCKITVIGSYMTDLTVYADRFPSDGEAVHGSRFHIAHGGKGSNQAIAAHRAGADVIFIAKLGNDKFGFDALDFYKKEGIDTRFISMTDKAPTGMTSITVNTVTGENRMVLFEGANMHLTAEDVYKAEGEIAKSDIILFQNETSLESIMAGMILAKQYGIKTVFNPAPTREIPEDLLTRADYITPNQSEAEFYSGVKADSVDTAKLSCKRLMFRGCDNIVLTMGAQGSFYYGDCGYVYTKAVKTDAVDTTGAGDSFNGAFCVALAEGMDIEDALNFANAAASLCVERHGTADAMPYRGEIEAHRMVHYPTDTKRKR